MQSSYNVIKKNRISSETVYTINMPFVPYEDFKDDAHDDSQDEGPSIEETKEYAENIKTDAELKAKQIIDAAAAEAQRIKKEAYDSAFRKGYSEGLNKGVQDGLHKVDDIRKNAEDVLKEAHKASRAYIDSQKEEIVSLAFTIAEKVIGYEAKTDDSVIAEMVKRAIESSVSKGQVIIWVNPMDYAVIDCKRDELIKLAGENTVINIIKDNDISMGGCRIDTGLSIVDASIDGQLEKIREALLG